MSCTRSTVIFAAILSLAFVLVATDISAPAQTFTSLLSFDQANGANPYYVYLVQGANGQLYGTTSAGGANSAGTFFEMTTGGTLKTLYSFCSVSGCTDGSGPTAGLLLASDGNFYGTTTTGGATGQGVVYRMTPTGTLTTLYSFCAQQGCTDGYLPYVGLIQASNGILYGTTSAGGAGGDGTVFEITTAGKFTSLHAFTGGDGEFPDSRLVQGTNGNFYGTTYGAGGTVYEITGAGKLTTLDAFNGADGSGPTGALFLASNGTFYGTTSSGGANGGGAIYSMTAAGKLTTLYSFCALAGCADGGTPWGGLIQATDGNLYGTTSGGGTNGYGTIFEYSPTSKTLTTLYDFCSQSDCTDGANPYEGLLEDTNGTFYGTTYSGGAADYGTVFSVATGLGPFVAATTRAGKVAARVTILGTSLTDSTAVTFGGVSATFKVGTGGTSISTTVPTGAETGSIKVTTPGGTLTSNVTFMVTPQLQAFTPSSGAAGTQVTITGVSLTQAAAVTFGGVKAAFTVNSDTQVTATVPSDAKTGKIVITTPGGTASSATSFTVN